MFSVTRIRNGNAYLLDVGTPGEGIDLVLTDKPAVRHWFNLWLSAPEQCQQEMRKMIEKIAPEVRLGRKEE